MTNRILSPLSLTNNTLTIDLSNYATTSSIGSSYQKKLEVTSPLSLNATTNTLSIDLLSVATYVDDSGVFQKAITVTNNALSPLIWNNNTLSIDLTAYYRRNEGLFATLYASGTGISWIAIDAFYRVCSDTHYFYVQRVNPDTPSMNSWLNIATFGYNTTTKTSSFFYELARYFNIISF